MNTELYSLLNLPKKASTKDIERQFRRLSRALHPDKQHHSGNGEISARREVFSEVQKGYVYLTNPLTKVIYDEFGVPGLVVYEGNKALYVKL